MNIDNITIDYREDTNSPFAQTILSEKNWQICGITIDEESCVSDG